MYFGKHVAAACALMLASSAFAAPVSGDAAVSAADGFLRSSPAARRILPGRAAASARLRGSLWIVDLAPSGYIAIAGSDRCAPVVSFSPDDFAEPEAGSPADAQLRANCAWVESMEADGTAPADPGWARLAAQAAQTSKIRALAASTPDGRAESDFNGYVAPLLGSGWAQGAPYNDLSPLSSPCGCMATAAGQEIRYWRWPYRYEKSRRRTHGLRNAMNEYSEHTIRADGRVPFDYGKILASYPAPASTPFAADKAASYNAAYLSLWMQSLTGQSYKPGASGGTIKFCTEAEEYWFEKGPVMSKWRDGYANLWAAIKADLDWGSPVQVNTPAHQMVADGYAVDGDDVWLAINYGWGSPTTWVKISDESSYGNAGLADFQTGFRPQKTVQFEPLAKVCTNDVTLVWHMAPCYTNRTTGFTLEIAKEGGATARVDIASHGETTSYTATGLETGCRYTFTVTPVMAAGEGAGIPASASTGIGAPRPAPEILSVSSVACGIDLVQQGVFVECARGIVNRIALGCSESTTAVEAYSSHLTVLPDGKISVVKDGSVFTVCIDATEMAKDWDGDMLILTLVARNADGTEAYRNLMLRFNSMRQVLDGTFDIAEADATGPVWFCGTTVIDAKGQAVTFDAAAFQGTGTVKLVDTAGGGSFTFRDLSNFSGTLVFPPSDIVTLPSGMGGFRGTISLTPSSDLSFSHRIRVNLPATATLHIPANTQATFAGGAEIDAAITGSGFINVIGQTLKLGNLRGFTGGISIGDFDASGTLTVPAGQERNIDVWNGTLRLTLSKEQIAYGYSTDKIANNWDTVVFQDGQGRTIKSWYSSGSLALSIPASANTWTPDEYGTGRFSDAARWSQGLPAEGDYVIFDDTFGDSEMTLDLASRLRLGYVKVTGTKFQIAGTATTDQLEIDTLENSAPTTVKTSQIVPGAVVPNAKLIVAKGISIDCDIDHSIAGNIRDPYDLQGLYWEECWHGTVVFSGQMQEGLDPDFWGNPKSAVRLNGATGYFKKDGSFSIPVELKDDGATPAFDWQSGYSGSLETLGILRGDGTFKTSGAYAKNEIAVVNDVSGFAGAFDLSIKTVAIADAKPASNTGSDGRLHVCKAATVPAGKTWSAAGGLFLGEGGALAVNGTLAAKQIFTYGANASLTLEDGATIDVQAAMGGDRAPAISFKAGTYRAGNNATETKTVYFCAAAGRRTTLDANGCTVTLGPAFFSGPGDVYLTSSRSGGRFVLQGVGAEFTGAIHADISAGLSIKGDISKMGGRLSVSDIGLGLSSSNLGRIDAGSGAAIAVTVTKGDRMSGLEIGGVNLSGGATMLLRDADGNELAVFTEADAVDGKYTLAPDPDIVPVCILDYGFNGDMASAGTDTTALSIYNGTASYRDGSAIYMRCKPYIGRTFAMPDDEWTAFIRCTLPAADSSKPTIVLMFGANGGNLFGLVAGRGENTVALADGAGPIGGEVAVEDATSRQHVYAIVKSAGRVRLYVDGELKTDEAATVSVAKKFQIGSPHGGNSTPYAACNDADATVDFLKFYDFAAGAGFIETMNVLSVEPSGGSVPAGTRVTMAYGNPSASIWYRKYGETAYTRYSAPFALDTPGANIYYAQVRGAGGEIVVEDTMLVYLVTEPEPAEAAVAYYKSGAVGGGETPALVLEDGTSPAVLAAGGTMVVDAKSAGDILFADPLPANLAAIRVARDATFTAGDGGSATLGGVSIEIDAASTLTAGGGIALGTAAVAGGGTLAYAAYPAAKPALAATWTGTVELPAFRAQGHRLLDFCNNGTSKIRLKGITGGWLKVEDVSMQSELILDGGFILTDMSRRAFRFAKISGTGCISLSPGTYELSSFSVGELAEGYSGAVSNNMRQTAIAIDRLSLAAGTSVAPGTKILATGGTGAISIGEVYVGGAKAAVTYERRRDGADGDGFYVTSRVSAEGGVVTVSTDGTVSSVTVPLAAGFAGKIVVPASVQTLAFTGAEAGSSQLVLETSYGGATARYENILLIGPDGAISLDPDGAAGGVKVRPELDASAGDAEIGPSATLVVKTIPGLWYSVAYGDGIENGTVGGSAAGETPRVQATGARTALRPPELPAARGFYRIRVSPRE